MKKRRSIGLPTIVLLCGALSAGCASQPPAAPASKASPEAREAIENAADAIRIANGNRWVWRDTEDLLKEARAAADRGDNANAIELANRAKFQAEAAIIQYNYEKTHPRGY